MKLHGRSAHWEFSIRVGASDAGCRIGRSVSLSCLATKTLRLLGRVIQSCSEVFRIWLLVFRLVSQLQWREPRNIMIRMSDVTERTQFKKSCRRRHFGSTYKLDCCSHAGLFDILKLQIKLASQTSRGSFCTERWQWPANIWSCSLVCVHRTYYSHPEREK